MSFYNKKRCFSIPQICFVQEKTLPSSSSISFFPFLKNSIVCKRMSRFALQRNRATITVEATIIFSLLLATGISLLFFVEIFRMENRIAGALSNTARTMGQYAVWFNQSEVQQKENLLSYGLQEISVFAAQKMIFDEIGEAQLEKSFIEGGKEGVSFLGSYINGEYINLTVHYRVKIPVLFFELPSLPITQSCYLHGWCGKSGGADINSDKGQIVYITPYGTVYHLSRDCTHINLSVTKVSDQQVLLLRNSGGGKYYPCEKCCEEERAYGTVWITHEGDRYHAKRNCSGIKRSLQAVLLSEVGNRSCCSKCKKE